MAHHEVVDEAFSENDGLARRIHAAIRDQPSNSPLFLEIANHVRMMRSTLLPNGARDGDPMSKKRKLDNGMLSQTKSESFQSEETEVIYEARDISFAMPVRKKLQLQIAQHVSLAPGGAIPVYQVLARNQTSGEVEYTMSMQSFKHALHLPVPEKAQKQSSFVLIPEYGLGIGDKASKDGGSKEPLVWTVGDGPQKINRSNDEKSQVQHGDLMEQTLNKCLEKTSARKLIRPEEVQFSSAMPEAHRKGEKAYHVKAFRGSKDGYLFFLASGIFFGFKKPLAFFPFEAIDAISYTSVLQRTFNLNIAVRLPDQEEGKEYEFSMIDQADFAGIDAYIKRHGLQDGSLAASRKARSLNLNKKGSGGGGAQEDEEQGELQKAQQQIADDEDDEEEEEEDYDPGSEGLSDGSGESSEEEGDETEIEQPGVTRSW